MMSTFMKNDPVEETKSTNNIRKNNQSINGQTTDDEYICETPREAQQQQQQQQHNGLSSSTTAVPTTDNDSNNNNSTSSNNANPSNNNNHNQLLLTDAPMKPYPRKRRLFERIQQNRRIHKDRMKNTNHRHRRLLEDHYRVAPIITTTATAATTTTTNMNATTVVDNTNMHNNNNSKLYQPRYFNSNNNNNTNHHYNYKQHPPRRPAVVILPGAPKYEDDWARDSHDFFNLVVLVPLVAVNALNWNWDIIFHGISQMIYSYHQNIRNIVLLLLSTATTKQNTNHHHHHHNHIGILRRLVAFLRKQQPTNTNNNNNYIIISQANNHKNTAAAITVQFVSVLQKAWTGEWFELFLLLTILYFVIDLIWILIVPQAVRSPSTIIQHHIATLLYIIIPYYYVDCRWCMGACMIVEVNTWFLIARRVFNKQGFPPWTIVDLSFLSIRVKVISIFFYITWITIRCLLYPALMVPFYRIWMNHSTLTGTKINLIGLCVPLHATFCLLNLKWTYELLMSKLRYYWRVPRNNNNNNNNNNNRTTAISTTSTSTSTMKGSGNNGSNYYYLAPNNYMDNDVSKGL